MDTQHSGMSHQWVCLASSKTRQTRTYYQTKHWPVHVNMGRCACCTCCYYWRQYRKQVCFI